jgi:cytochrome c biogenesis protein CcmG/thiol:disulfide interchange protein DsbE
MSDMQPIHRRILYVLLLLAGFAWIILTADKTGISTSGRIPAPIEGFIAPDFSLKTPTGEQFTLYKLHGEAVLVNIWATWCPPCRAEMPVIQKYYQQYEDQGFIVLGVNSTIQDSPLEIVLFIDQYKLTFPILLDETGELGPKYDLRSLPSSFFINRNSTIASVVIGGPMSDALLRTKIEEILRSPANYRYPP